MAIIAVIQQKGGVGKSTITANLAGELVSSGRSVKVFDLDPQQSLASWSRLGDGLLKEIVQVIPTDNPGDFKTSVMSSAGGFDRVLLDCPPGLPDSGIMAALLADLVILPVTPSPLDILAGKEALIFARDAQRKRKNGKPVIRFAPARLSVNTVLSKDLPASLENLGEPILPGTSQRVAVAEAVLMGLTVGEYAPQSKAHQEFQELAKAVEEIVQ